LSSFYLIYKLSFVQIWKKFNKQKKRDYWHARFKLNNKAFTPKAETKDKLLNLIAEIRSQEAAERNNKKFNLNFEVISYVPTVAEVFEKILPTFQKPHYKTFADRVFEVFLSLLPAMIKVTELKKTHFQLYVVHRSGQLGKQSNQPIRRQTISKELYAVTAALRQAALYYDSLENWQLPPLPELPKGFSKKTQRQRLVTEKELADLIAELMKEPEGKQTRTSYLHRVRLAHQIEFQYWTGLRRKEIARLKFSQYDASQQALLNIKRWKTDSVTKFFPLGRRAIEIINLRRELQEGSEFIFTPDGEPIASQYRTLSKICKDLKIPYGRFVDGGFIAHDLRHNFGTDILRGSDIETARELLGHSNIMQTGTYIHTSTDQMRRAVLKRDKIDYKAELKIIFNEVKSGELEEQEFNEKLRELFGF
jgi:integrase